MIFVQLTMDVKCEVNVCFSTNVGIFTCHGLEKCVKSFPFERMNLWVIWLATRDLMECESDIEGGELIECNFEGIFYYSFLQLCW